MIRLNRAIQSSSSARPTDPSPVATISQPPRRHPPHQQIGLPHQLDGCLRNSILNPDVNRTRKGAQVGCRYESSNEWSRSRKNGSDMTHCHSPVSSRHSEPSESRVHDRNRLVFIDSRTLGCPPTVCLQSRRKRNTHSPGKVSLLPPSLSFCLVCSATTKNRATFISRCNVRSSQLRHCTSIWISLLASNPLIHP